MQTIVDAIDTCASPPVLVGHSLGGLLCLLAAQQRPVKALALLSPIPADGMWRSLLALGALSPLSLAKFLAVTVDGRVAQLAASPLGIYSKACDPALTQRITARLRGESLPMLASTLWRKPPPKPSAPLHFFGAEGDYIIPPREVRRIAKLYDAPVTIYPGMSHVFQAEPDWQVMAQDIADWLSTSI